jgi:wyosine [tRNA(Phe)-imidazoG37] synthetase (radical SAM superfamily)
MQTLKLKEGIIYGPINSRRLGSSLGINLLPTEYKLCSFNCLYCHYGWTKVHTMDATSHLSDFPSIQQVKEALESWFESHRIPVDYVTFSGNGEPCLHPDFDRMVDIARQVKQEYAPHAQLAILSNSTCLDNPRVLSGLKKLDVRIMKLDCGTEAVFRKLNRPHSQIRFDKVVENLKKVENIIIQSLFAEGGTDNTQASEVDEWIGKLGHIKPKEVQIYSIDRPTADSGLTLVSKDRLSQIAKKAQEVTGIPVKVF